MIPTVAPTAFGVLVGTTWALRLMVGLGVVILAAAVPLFLGDLSKHRPVPERRAT